MSTESRLQELCTINNNIIVECNKMTQYLQIILEKSDYAVSYLNSLNTANILRRYSSTYEYLNRFHIKLLEQNCSFELFFLEMDEQSTDISHSIYPNVNDVAESAVLVNRNQNTIETERSTSNQVEIANVEVNTSEADRMLPTDEENTEEIIHKINDCYEEFQYESASSSVSVKSDLIEDLNTVPSITNDTQNSITAEDKMSVKNTDKAKFDKFILQSRLNNQIDDNNTNCKSTDLCSTSSDNSESQISEDERKNSLDVKKIINNVKDKLKDDEIPDLKPVWKNHVRKARENLASTSVSNNVDVPNHSNARTKAKVLARKINQQVERSKLNQIEIKMGLPPKEGDLCCISSVESPYSFYIHVIRDENTFIDSLSVQIAEISHILQSFLRKKDAQRYINDYCVCDVDTFSWCRVRILDWMPQNENILEVRLIDYGIKCKVPLLKIRQANRFLFELPAMADQCRLAWVKPKNGEDEWSKDSVEYFGNVLKQSDRLFTISYVSEDFGCLTIDLQNNEIVSVAGLMISDEKAEDEYEENNKWNNNFMNKQILKSQGFTEEEFKSSDDDRLEEFLLDDEDEEELNDPNLAVSHYKPKDEENICRIYLSRGSCFKGKNCTFSHEPLNPDGWTTDKESVYLDAFNQLQLPPPESEITVKVLSIVDLRTFYVVIKNMPPCPALFGMAVHNIRSLAKLMNDPAETKDYRSFTVIPAVGEIILVKYEDNWQRGRVLSFSEYSFKVDLEVFLVDFGIVGIFNMKHCRKIQAKHLYVPFQVVLCTLSNVTLKDDLTDAEIEMGNVYLEMNVGNKKLNARVMYSATYLNVLLFTEGGKDVGEELIKAQIALRNSQVPSPKEYGLLVD